MAIVATARPEPGLPARRPAPDRTPDGRYIVVDGRLWRATNPHLPASDRERQPAS